MPMPPPPWSKNAGVLGPCHIPPAVMQEDAGFLGHDLKFTKLTCTRI